MSLPVHENSYNFYHIHDMLYILCTYTDLLLVITLSIIINLQSWELHYIFFLKEWVNSHLIASSSKKLFQFSWRCCSPLEPITCGIRLFMIHLFTSLIIINNMVNRTIIINFFLKFTINIPCHEFPLTTLNLMKSILSFV